MSLFKPGISAYKKQHTLRAQVLWPAGLLLGAFILMILPLEGFVSSVKAVLAYVFIPQVRVAHSTTQYAGNVSQTVQELLQAHQENVQLKQEIEGTQLLAMQAQEVFAENQRLTQLLQLKPSLRWNGVWAKVAYREPTQWNTVVLDKGAQAGITPRSAVIALQDGQAGLAGVVVEVTENTAKVLLVRDEDFAAAVRLGHGEEEGLLQGNGPRAVQIKYVPLLAQVEKGDRVFTSVSSQVFPAGILIGQVSAVREPDGFQTALTVEIVPQVHVEAIHEVFVITGEKK